LLLVIVFTNFLNNSVDKQPLISLRVLG